MTTGFICNNVLPYMHFVTGCFPNYLNALIVYVLCTSLACTFVYVDINKHFKCVCVCQYGSAGGLTVNGAAAGVSDVEVLVLVGLWLLWLSDEAGVDPGVC